MKKVEPFSVPSKKVELPSASPAKKAEPAAAEEDDDDDIDLFGSDDEEEDQEAAKVREERLRQYAEKKAKKPGLIAKSSILLDVKPVSKLLPEAACPVQEVLNHLICTSVLTGEDLTCTFPNEGSE